MTKKEFENALGRSIEALLDGGQPGIDDILLISKALGGVNFELMSEDERDTYILGAQAGYMLGIGESYQAMFWEVEDENLTPSVELITCQQDLSDYIVDNKNMIEEDVRTSINNILTDINVAEGRQEFDIFDEVNLDILVDEVADNLITGLINVIRTYEPTII